MGNRLRGTANQGALYFGEHHMPGQPEQLFPFGEEQRQPRAPVQHTSTVRSDVQLKKQSLTLVKIAPDGDEYRVEFAISAAVPCNVTVLTQVTETVEEGARSSFSCVGEMPDAQLVPEGVARMFRQPDNEAFRLNEGLDAVMCANPGGRWPLVIHLETQPGTREESTEEDALRGPQSHTTFVEFKRLADGSYEPKIVKQKLVANGTAFVLQEIFGIEGEGGGTECVVCMAEMRDTTVLPCRHMCLCAECGEQLRQRSNKCPICRRPFTSLLRIHDKRAPAVAGNNAASEAVPIPTPAEGELNVASSPLVGSPLSSAVPMEAMAAAASPPNVAKRTAIIDPPRSATAAIRGGATLTLSPEALTSTPPVALDRVESIDVAPVPASGLGLTPTPAPAADASSRETSSDAPKTDSPVKVDGARIAVALPTRMPLLPPPPPSGRSGIAAGAAQQTAAAASPASTTTPAGAGAVAGVASEVRSDAARAVETETSDKDAEQDKEKAAQDDSPAQVAATSAAPSEQQQPAEQTRTEVATPASAVSASAVSVAPAVQIPAPPKQTVASLITALPAPPVAPPRKKQERVALAAQ